MTKRLFKLTEAHSRLDTAVRTELRRRVPDGLKLLVLKKLKLKAKDMIARVLRKRSAT